MDKVILNSCKYPDGYHAPSSCTVCMERAHCKVCKGTCKKCLFSYGSTCIKQGKKVQP